SDVQTHGGRPPRGAKFDESAGVQFRIHQPVRQYAVADPPLDRCKGGIDVVGHETGLQPQCGGTPVLSFEGNPARHEGDELNGAAAVELRGMLDASLEGISDNGPLTPSKLMHDQCLITDGAGSDPKIIAPGGEIARIVNEPPVEGNPRMFEQEAGRDIDKECLADRHRDGNANRSPILIAAEPCGLESPAPQIQ